jgi:hypothetical protein
MRTIGFVVIGAILGLALLPAHAQEPVPSHPALTDTFYFAAGVFRPKTSTSAQLDSTNLGAGANIDFERALGMTTQESVPDYFARWRFSERWRLEVEYFELNRRGDKVLEQDIT